MKKQNIYVMLILSLFLVSCGQDTTENQTELPVVNQEVEAEVSTSDQTESLSVVFTDPSWDGTTVPEGQWCSTFDGEGSTPELSVENIPTGTKALSMSYSDRSFAANDNGGHGIVGITIQDELSYVDVPSIAGESLELPENMFVIEEARSSRSSGGAYLPPCSGGNGNEYYLTVTALDSTDVATANVLATQDIEMGVY